jgi:hypothetical protein
LGSVLQQFAASIDVRVMSFDHGVKAEMMQAHRKPLNADVFK